MTSVRLRSLALLALATLSLMALSLAGATTTLRTPPAGSWAELSSWYEQTGPEAAVVATLRVVAMAGAAWLMVASALHLFASFSARAGLQRVADAASPFALRRLLHGVAGLSVTAGLAMPAVPREDPPGVAVMEILEDDDEPTEEGTIDPPPITDTTTTTTSGPPGTTSEPPAEPLAPAAVPVPAPREHAVVVTPGDSFWSLAADVVAETAGADPDEGQVAAYWLRLIDSNRTHLVDPANPDLIYPGQELTLPPP